MTLYNKNLLNDDSESSLGRQEGIAPDVSVEKSNIELITPEKFRKDVDALLGYIGAERFVAGLRIDVSLSEILAVIPRKRRRREAYSALQKYLNNERKIELIIKTSRNGYEKTAP